MNEFKDNIEKILKQYDCKDFDGFNIFRILKLTKNEVKTQSKLIAELLKSESIYHNNGESFFKEFLQIMFDDNFGFNEQKVFTEEPFKFNNVKGELISGRIDILIQSADKKKAIIIENKVYAKDQVNQLEKYYEYCISEYGDINNFRILYLTQHGENYKTNDTRLQDKIINISYKNEIKNWLKVCSFLCNDQFQKIILEQWINSIDYLTNIDKRRIRNRLIQYEIYKNISLFKDDEDEIKKLKNYLNNGISKHKKLFDSHQIDLIELLKEKKYPNSLTDLTKEDLFRLLNIKNKLKFSDIIN